MKEASKMKAISLLLRHVGLLADRKHIPAVYIVDNDISLNWMAAMRHQRNLYAIYGIKHHIYRMSIEEAYAMSHNNRKLPAVYHVERNFDTFGTYDKANDQFYEWQYTYNCMDDNMQRLMFLESQL